MRSRRRSTRQLVLVCVIRDTESSAISANGIFAVNVLGDQQEPISRYFAGRPASRPHAFKDIPHRVAVTGSPLIDGGAAYLDCGGSPHAQATSSSSARWSRSARSGRPASPVPRRHTASSQATDAVWNAGPATDQLAVGDRLGPFVLRSRWAPADGHRLPSTTRGRRRGRAQGAARGAGRRRDVPPPLRPRGAQRTLVEARTSSRCSTPARPAAATTSPASTSPDGRSTSACDAGRFARRRRPGRR